MGKRGHLPLWKCCKVFLCINNYSKTLSRRIICALFSQTVVRFWGYAPRFPPELHPWTVLGTFVSRPLICPPLENNPAGAYVTCSYSFITSVAVVDLLLLCVWQCPVGGVSDSHTLPDVRTSAPKIFDVSQSLPNYFANQADSSCTARLLICNVIAVKKCTATAWNLDSLS